MEISKPELSEAQKRANEIYRYMRRVGRAVEKKELCAALGWEYTPSNERRIREIISMIAKRRPIIATSDRRGYRVAQTASDVEDVRHQWLELDKRIEELSERRKPLREFLDKENRGVL